MVKIIFESDIPNGNCHLDQFANTSLVLYQYYHFKFVFFDHFPVDAGAAH